MTTAAPPDIDDLERLFEEDSPPETPCRYFKEDRLCPNEAVCIIHFSCGCSDPFCLPHRDIILGVKDSDDVLKCLVKHLTSITVTGVTPLR